VCSKNLKAQATPYIGDFTLPEDIIIINDNIYVSELGGGLTKVTITESNPTQTNIGNSAVDARGLTFDGNYLYFPDINNNSIRRINILETSPVISDFLVYEYSGNNVFFIGHGIVVSDNFLYFVRSSEDDQSKMIISKVNITDPSLLVEDIIVVDHYIRDFVFYQNFIYFVNSDSDIVKINTSDSNPIVENVISNLNEPTYMAIKGNELFFSETQENKISKVNLNSSDLTPSFVVSIASPKGIAFKNDDLFIIGGDWIYKFSISTLKIDNVDSLNKNIFPNPSNDFIKINNITTNTIYEIYNTLGIKVLEGKINNKEKINIENLKKGLYIIKFSNLASLKFMKK
jgi:hypothetical protein